MIEVQQLEDSLPTQNTRKVWEDLEAAEARARMARTREEAEAELARAAGHEAELRRLAEVEHERSRRVHAVLGLCSTLEVTRAALTVKPAPAAELSSTVAEETRLLVAAAAEIEAVVASCTR